MDCSAPEVRSRVLGRITLDDGTYPGAESARATARQRCLGAHPEAGSESEVAIPSFPDWEAGSRVAVCLQPLP